MQNYAKRHIKLSSILFFYYVPPKEIIQIYLYMSIKTTVMLIILYLKALYTYYGLLLKTNT